MVTAPIPAARPRVLSNKKFRLLWMGNTVSLVGDPFYLVAMPWLVLGLTRSSEKPQKEIYLPLGQRSLSFLSLTPMAV
jgi:hypothetical protein